MSEKCKNVIVYFFTKNKINSKPDNLVELIEKCKKFRNTIFSNLDNYIIKKEDFFCLEATENYRLYKYLVKKYIFQSYTQEQKTNYISKSLKVVLSLQDKIEKYEINYKTLIAFFKNEESIQSLLKMYRALFFLS